MAIHFVCHREPVRAWRSPEIPGRQLFPQEIASLSLAMTPNNMMKKNMEERESIGLKDVAADVRALLEYAATLGMKEVPIADLPASARREPSEARGIAASEKRTVAQEPVVAEEQLTPADKAKAMAALREEMGDCRRCKLYKGRTHLVFGEGNPDARLMFVGEGPGQDEDLQGRPFVGAAGQLLTKIIEAMGLKREDVYIANIVKSRPPNNRNPEPDEVAACIPFLHRQIEIVAPDVIVCLGSVAMQNLLGTEEKITRMRGHFKDWRGIPVMPTYHPAFLLRNAAMKKPVWEDMKKVMEKLGAKSK